MEIRISKTQDQGRICFLLPSVSATAGKSKYVYKTAESQTNRNPNIKNAEKTPQKLISLWGGKFERHWAPQRVRLSAYVSWPGVLAKCSKAIKIACHGSCCHNLLASHPPEGGGIYLYVRP